MADNTSLAEVVVVSFEPEGTGASQTSPEVSFLALVEGASVTGDVLIRATLSAAAGLSTVEWLVDGESTPVARVSGQSSGVSFLWRAGTVPTVRHTIARVVTDTNGRQTTGLLGLVKP